MIKAAIHKSFRLLGFDLVRYRDSKNRFPPDFREDEISIMRDVLPWTLTTPERLYALIQAVRYVTSNQIPGAMVECGVWKGGSMAAVARTLLGKGDVKRELYLFDTFEGMSAPTSKDIEYSGKTAAELIASDPGHLCIAPLDTVRAVMHGTGYPSERVHFIQGKVEDTIPSAAPETISLLRLDTDWYESTKHELIHLYPRLSRNGVIIIDDYGHWEGARRACDEYFPERGAPVFLSRIDYTGRIAVKL
ncbi:MAG: TylF/MycF/NovP-related O-methyltransferase [Candidatus Acidiferrales bacterium]